MTPLSIRQATIDDLRYVADLLFADAERRRSLDPILWPIDTDSRARIEAALHHGLASSNAATREMWLLAEAQGRVVGITHAMIVPVPPIYRAEGSPGLFLDDCFTIPEAPSGTAEALLLATEAALRAAGASALIASCPVAGSWRALYTRFDYEPVTLYMVKHGFPAAAVPSGVRAAGLADVPGIVQLSADHRTTLARLNPRFWQIHPEADSRFEAWMRYSLTLKDRDMFVAGAPGEVRGYIIAQPASPLLVPAAHDIRALGVIDDFYDLDFADVSAVSNGGAAAADLIAAAESAFARRGVASALAVCPAAWTSKLSLLRRKGYRAAKLWMLKR
jgi:GNAT superfamily N-acetyltransferase